MVITSGEYRVRDAMIVGSSPTVVRLSPFSLGIHSGIAHAGRNRATSQHLLCLRILAMGALEYGSRGYLTQLLHACMHATCCMHAMSVPIHHIYFFCFFDLIFRIQDNILCLDNFPIFCLWVFRSHKCSQNPKTYALRANIHTHFAILSHLHGGLAWTVNCRAFYRVHTRPSSRISMAQFIAYAYCYDSRK